MIWKISQSKEHGPPPLLGWKGRFYNNKNEHETSTSLNKEPIFQISLMALALDSF